MPERLRRTILRARKSVRANIKFVEPCLKVTQPFLCFWVIQVYICLSLRNVSVHVAGFSYHLRWVLLPPWWKIYSQVSPRKFFENLTFSTVSRAVPSGVLRQGVCNVLIWRADLPLSGLEFVDFSLICRFRASSMVCMCYLYHQLFSRVAQVFGCS